MDWIDLRSDTVACSTDVMRSVMLAVKMGDDVYDEDHTVRFNRVRFT